MARAKTPTATTLSQSELFFLGKLQAARRLRAHAKEAEKVWLDLGRKEGLDVDKVVKVLNQEEKQSRKRHPELVLPG